MTSENCWIMDTAGSGSFDPDATRTASPLTPALGLSLGGTFCLPDERVSASIAAAAPPPAGKMPTLPSPRLQCGFLRATLALLLTLLPFTASAQEPAIVTPLDGPAYREGRILIIPKAGRAAALGRFHGQMGARLRKAFRRLADIQVVELPRGLAARDAVARYRQSGHVESVSLDYLIHVSAAPNDPLFASGSQWHLNNTGQAGGLADADLDGPEGWSIRNSASNIVVAVIDSGIRQSHQDLRDNLWTNPGEIAGNGFDDDGNGYVDDVHGIDVVSNDSNPEDDYYHGTHVSGIIGAAGNNGLGVSGVAWRVKLMACKFLNASGDGSISDMKECLDYALSEGANVINCSFEAPLLPLESQLIISNAFWSSRNAGVIIVAAAGNGGIDTDVFPKFPASFGAFGMDNVISVTATTRTDGHAYNYGATSVHLGAPGVSIYSTRNQSDSHYTSDSGTSYAAPCVAGAAALMLAEFPGLTYRQIIDRLLATVDPLPSLAGLCTTGGRLNLANALAGGYAIRPAAYSWVPTNGMTSIVLADDGVSTARALPFTFPFGGRHYTNLYISANGLVGFANVALGATGNMDLPTTASPNAIICPLWDNLNPAAGGSVWFGVCGVAPYRSVVVSWVDVPHFVTTGGQTRFTFQVLLHESGQIAFQYASVQSGHPTYVRGLSATIGVEDFMGAVAAKYSYNGTPVVVTDNPVTNNQSILFIPHGNTGPLPLLTRLDGPQGGQFQLRVTAQVGSRCTMKASDDLSTWTNLATNVIPASGLWNFTDTTAGAHLHRFYQAASLP